MKNNYPSFRKYSRMPHLAEILDLLDHEIEIYEKLDGGNSQIRKYKGRVICGNKSKFLKNPKYFTQDWFKVFQDFALSNYSFYNLPENLIVYGEFLSKHTLDYYPEFTDKFFLIDIFDLSKNKYVQYKDSQKLLNNLGIEKVNFLETLAVWKFSFKDLEKFIHGSKYRDGDKEGIVIKNYSLQKFAKLWTSSVKRKPITDQNISRIVHGLKDKGRKISVSLVYDELISECKRSGFNKLIDEWKIREKIIEYLHEL